MVNYFIETDFHRLIVLVRDMNTTQKFCRIAQLLLNHILRSIQIDKYADLNKQIKSSQNQKGEEDIAKLFDILIAYSERHYQRL